MRVDGTERGVRKMQRAIRTVEATNKPNIQWEAVRTIFKAWSISLGKATRLGF